VECLPGGWDAWAHLFLPQAAKSLREVAWTRTLLPQSPENRRSSIRRWKLISFL